MIKGINYVSMWSPDSIPIISWNRHFELLLLVEKRKKNNTNTPLTWIDGFTMRTNTKLVEPTDVTCSHAYKNDRRQSVFGRHQRRYLRMKSIWRTFWQRNDVIEISCFVWKSLAACLLIDLLFGEKTKGTLTLDFISFITNSITRRWLLKNNGRFQYKFHFGLKKIRLFIDLWLILEHYQNIRDSIFYLVEDYITIW